MSTLDGLDFFQRHPDVVRSVRTHCCYVGFRMMIHYMETDQVLTVASLTFQVWDTMLTFEDEVDYIWPIPWTFKMKWWYLYFRYVTLAAHIAYSVSVSYLTSGDAPGSTCKAWFLFTIIIAMFSKTLIELMFVIRVYALFNRRRWVLFLLCMLCAVEPVINLIAIVCVVPQVGFDEACILLPASSKDLPYAALTPIAQTILVGTTLIKSFLAVRAGWGRTPLVRLLIREALASYVVFMTLAAFAIVICLRETMQMISLTIWATAILSTCGCRLTINMQLLARKHNLGRRTRPDSVAIFTSQIELAEL